MLILAGRIGALATRCGLPSNLIAHFRGGTALAQSEMKFADARLGIRGLATSVTSRLNWRYLALSGIVLIALGDPLTSLNHGYRGIVAARICAGAGEGLAVAVSFAALGSVRAVRRPIVRNAEDGLSRMNTLSQGA